ncbi:MAG: hypothetical protein RL693_564 [Verrucomicrobiota bacterium]|jgi:hypothetical protein
MLEFFRKHQGTFWIVITVVVIVSFTFWGGQTQRGDRKATGTETAFTIYGNTYSFDEMSRLERNYELAMRLGLRGFAETLSFITQKYQIEGRVPFDFALNLLVLRKELEKNGIHATDAEVKQEFKKMPAFQVNGQFDGSRADFFENELGTLGFRQADLYQLLRDWIGLQKLQKLVAANYVAPSFVAKQYYSAGYQTIKVATIPFATETFKATANVSPEELKKYFEEKKDTFKTQEKRAFSYVFIEKPNVEKLNAEDTVKARNAFGVKVNDFAAASIEPNANFEALAKAAGFEVKNVPLFSIDAPPAELKDDYALLVEVFRNTPSVHPVSDPIESSKGYFVFKVTQIEEPKPEEFAAVEGKIRDTLVAQKAQEALMKAVNDARKQIEDAMKAGKKFEDAAKDAKLTPQMLPEFSPANPPTDLSNGSEIAAEAEKTPVGQFTKPLSTENGVILVHVVAKELRKREDGDKSKAGIEKSLSTFNQRNIFRAWFEGRRNDAKEDANTLLRRAAAGQQS